MAQINEVEHKRKGKWNKLEKKNGQDRRTMSKKKLHRHKGARGRKKDKKMKARAYMEIKVKMVDSMGRKEDNCI